MPILGPDGRALANCTVRLMRPDQVQWFMDPIALLTGAPHLWTLNVRLYCQHCQRRGLRDQIVIHHHDQQDVWTVRCECSAVPARLTLHQVMQYASSTDELLKKLGWSFCCTGRCAAEPGYGDGIEASNDPMAMTWSVRCGCTDRRFTRAAA